jgi:hypothetical protein
MLRKIIPIIIFLFSSFLLSAQESRLADIYYNDGEFEKAAMIYKSLYEKNKGVVIYFQK